MKKRSVINIVLTVAVIGALLWGTYSMMPRQTKKITDKQIVSLFKEDKVESYELDFNNGKLSLVLKEENEEFGGKKVKYELASIPL